MARKIKFALEMKDGAKVRSNLEELRENFDLEKAVGYFLSGKLTEWLEDRYYEEEAEALDAIDKDAPDLREKLCAALGVPYEGGSELDIEALERLNEKKAVLRQKTGDESIIANADKTALTQEDLADLLDMDEPVIYLCGDSFNIPARVKNKKYVGILGTPTITIKAKSQEEVDNKGIVFENVKLPWGEAEAKKDSAQACPKCSAKNPAAAKFCNSCGASMDGTVAAPATPSVKTSNKIWRVPKAQLKAMFAGRFKQDFAYYEADANATFLMYGDGDEATTELTDVQKETVLSLVCGGQYAEEDLVHLRIAEDMTRGWAFTADSFCAVSTDDPLIIIPYESPMRVRIGDNGYYVNNLRFDYIACAESTKFAIYDFLKNIVNLFAPYRKNGGDLSVGSHHMRNLFRNR